MAKYAWASDIHLDHLFGESDIAAFAVKLTERDVDGVIITGDISSAKKLTQHLRIIEWTVQRPVYFVCGNHDFWYSSIAKVREEMKLLSDASHHLRYLPTVPYVALSKQTALVGHDGWYDGRNGNAMTSRFFMVDWELIDDYKPFVDNGLKFGLIKDRTGLIKQSELLSHEAVQHVRNGITAAIPYHKHIIVATHVPPFAESHIYGGRVGDSNAQPWFTSREMGDMLLEEANARHDVHFTVLAGHTHGKYDGKVAHNLEVHVAGARYGSPDVASLIEVK